MAEGEFALVRQHLEAAIGKLALPIGWPVADHDLYALLADVCALQHDLGGLRRYAPQAEALAARYGHTLYQAIAHRAWGVAHWLASEYTQAETRLNQALELFRGLDTRWQIGRTFFELGELALAQKDSITARGHFSRALTMFDEMGAAPDAARTRAALEALATVD
jgi:tetratricopeptide (TPR) repeat protein